MFLNVGKMTVAAEVPKNVVVMDLEFTAWEGSVERNWSGPDVDPEIIQIGAVILINENSNWEIGATFKEYVRPTVRPILSRYIKSLTGIQQSVIDQYGLAFDEALDRFKEFFPRGAVLVSNGPDWHQLDRNCLINKRTNPFPEKDVLNIRPYLSEKLELSLTDERLNSYQLHKVWSGKPGAAHDALSDALAVAHAAIKLGILDMVSWDENICRLSD